MEVFGQLHIPDVLSPA